jgi:HSP20 family molecular chaperone IbpA
MEEEDEIIEVDAEGEEVKQRKIVLSNMDVSGFRPEEINVKLQGNKIVVRGEYKNRNEGRHYILYNLMGEIICKWCTSVIAMRLFQVNSL